MGGDSAELKGPDLTRGVPFADVPDGGVLLGHAGGEAVFVARRGVVVHALGATCTHYGGPLSEGLIDGDRLTCPWHHACFDITTGEAVGGPALNPVACWNVERRDDLIVLTGKRATPVRAAPKSAPASVVIIGAGASGGTLAEALRREGYAGKITLVGEEPVGPVDRPNLSKDYLAGTAPEEWIPLRSSDYYAENTIDLQLSTRATAVDVTKKSVAFSDGTTLPYDALVLATGAAPVTLDLPGASRILYLRTLADSRAIIQAATNAKRAVILGASFIGLEAAAALRTRGLEVDVVAPDTLPLARILGDELGAFVKALHEEKGVRFHLERRTRTLAADSVTLDDGATLQADLVVAGLGVRPRTELAEAAGIACDRGITVGDRFETSAPSVYAIGDVARYPDRLAAKSVRIEHWVVAERQAQALARNLVGRGEPYQDVPFFWSQHYDVPIAYVGHAETWDRVRVVGNVAGKDCLVGFERAGKIVAVASIFRDTESLLVEAAYRRGDFAAVAKLFA